MLVTKWKNSSPKAKSVTVMLVILLSLTLCLMAFLPFFQTRAASEFSTPLTEMSFIEQLYQSNYIQYKYLKEKTDQKNWSYQVILHFLPLQPLIRSLTESLPTLRLTPPFLTVIWKKPCIMYFCHRLMK